MFAWSRKLYQTIQFPTGLWWIIRMSIALALGISIVGGSVLVLANERVQFTIRAIPSDRQVDKQASYFDLLLSPGEEHVLEVEILNSADQPMNASVNACTAGTNPGGVIDYDNPHVSDDSLKVPFADIAVVENPVVTVPAVGSAKARIKITMPDDPFDGIILGGIVVTKDEDSDSETNVSGTSIQNEYCYIIGAKIRVNDTVVEPDFRLRFVEPALSNYRTSIAANLQNFEAAIAKGMSIDANVYYNNESEPIYSSSNRNFDAAPNSNFNYIIPCSGKLPVGDYRLLLTAKLGERLWEFDDTFVITDVDANNINDKAVNVPGVNYYRIATICLAVLLIVLLVGILLWIIVAKRRSKNDRG